MEELVIWGPMLAFITSIIYYATDRGGNRTARAISSAHGALITVLYISAALVMKFGRANDYFAVPYMLLFLLPIASMMFALKSYRGHRAVHLLQLLNVGAIGCAIFIGTMAVSGSWL